MNPNNNNNNNNNNNLNLGSGKMRVILRPNQSIGATFEYNNYYKALQITEFVTNSTIEKYGVKIGMFLTHIDDLQVIDLKQDDIIFILRKKSSLLRELIFSSIIKTIKDEKKIHGSILPKLKQTNSLDQSNISNTLNHSSLSFSSTTSTSPIHSNSLSHSANSTPTNMNNVNSHFHSVFSQNHLNSSNLSSSSTTLMSKSITEQQLGYSRIINNNNNNNISNNNIDPFSTPARRRRLIADISRFLLKQYCEKACQHVAFQRYQKQCAIKIQCFFRQYRSRKILKQLQYIYYTRYATNIQRFYRCCIAREKLNERIKHRVKLKYLAMTIRIQTKFRQHRAQKLYNKILQVCPQIQNCIRRYLAKKLLIKLRLKRDKQYKLQLDSAQKIQNKFRQHQAKLVLRHLLEDYYLRKNMKFRIVYRWRKFIARKKYLSSLMIQKHWRRVQSKIIYSWLKERKEHEMRELELMIKEDLHSRYIHDNTIDLSICLAINQSMINELHSLSVFNFLHWSILSDILKFDIERNHYSIGLIINNLLEIWNNNNYNNLNSNNVNNNNNNNNNNQQKKENNSFKEKSERIEVSNLSIQSKSSLNKNDIECSDCNNNNNNNNKINQDINYPNVNQVPKIWGERYPKFSSKIFPKNTLRLKRNRFNQIILSFENYLNWNDLSGELNSLKNENERKIYNVNIIFGSIEITKDYNSDKLFDCNKNVNNSNINKSIPKLEFENLEVLVSLTSTNPELGVNRTIYHIEKENINSCLDGLITNELNTNNLDENLINNNNNQDNNNNNYNNNNNDDKIKENINIIQDDLLFINSTINTSNHLDSNSIGDDDYDKMDDFNFGIDQEFNRNVFEKNISRPTTATTRLFIVKEEVVDNTHEKNHKEKMLFILNELQYQVELKRMKRIQIETDKLKKRIMVKKIQICYREHFLYKLKVESVLKIQKYYKCYKYLQILQSTVYNVINKINIVKSFMLKVIQIKVAKEIVLNRRVKLCGNSVERRQDMINILNNNFLSSYNSMYGDNIVINNTQNDCLKQSVKTKQISQLSFLNSSSITTLNDKDPKLYSNTIWVDKLFQSINFQQSNFQDFVSHDIFCSQLPLINLQELQEEDIESIENTKMNDQVSDTIDDNIDNIDDNLFHSYQFSNHMMNVFTNSYDNLSINSEIPLNLSKYSIGNDIDEHIPNLFTNFKQRYFF